MGFVDKFRNGGLPKLPPREEQKELTGDSTSMMSDTTQCTAPAQSSRSKRRMQNDERIHQSFMYLNLPTAAERPKMQKDIDERKARDAEKE